MEFTADSVFYIATTKGTDQAILDALSNAISSALASDEVVEIVRNAAKTSVLISPRQKPAR